MCVPYACVFIPTVVPNLYLLCMVLVKISCSSFRTNLSLVFLIGRMNNVEASHLVEFYKGEQLNKHTHCIVPTVGEKD